MLIILSSLFVSISFVSQQHDFVLYLTANKVSEEIILKHSKIQITIPETVVVVGKGYTSLWIQRSKGVYHFDSPQLNISFYALSNITIYVDYIKGFKFNLHDSFVEIKNNISQTLYIKSNIVRFTFDERFVKLMVWENGSSEGVVMYILNDVVYELYGCCFLLMSNVDVMIYIDYF